MEIEYLKELADNPNKRNFPNKPIPETEIAELEELYNAGKPFPTALRELLYLAGDYCYVLDYGTDESQYKLQEFVREQLMYFEKTLHRPFFAIDVYNANDQFLFIYLDEDNDPLVYSGVYRHTSNWTFPLTYKLSNFINFLVEEVKQGRNPF